MNHNEWGDPNTYFGGWIVPDPLTAGQKLRVQKKRFDGRKDYRFFKCPGCGKKSTHNHYAVGYYVVYKTRIIVS